MNEPNVWLMAVAGILAWFLIFSVAYIIRDIFGERFGQPQVVVYIWGVIAMSIITAMIFI